MVKWVGEDNGNQRSSVDVYLFVVAKYSSAKIFFLSRSYVKKNFFGFMIFDDVFFSAMMGMSFFQV